MINLEVLRSRWITEHSHLILRFITNTMAFVLIVMFALFLFKALRDFDDYQAKFYLQLFSDESSLVLSYVIPTTSGMAIVLLFEPRLRLFGFYFALALLGVFSAYIGLALLMPSGNRPCSCISAIKGISWLGQLYFNLAFLLIAVIGVVLKRWEKQRQQAA